MKTIKVAQFGLGPIGIESVRLAASKPWIEVVGGIDIDPAKQGKPLAEMVTETGRDLGRVYGSFEELAAADRPDVVLHTAGSRAVESIAQILPMATAGVSVASSCEELLFPRLRAESAADALDAACRQHGARVVGTGVNPGFVMDLLPVVLTGVCRSVQGIYGERVVNASTRRGPLQKKIGSGMEPDTFRRLFADKKAGHAGFQESLALIAHSMGWPLDDVIETCEPMIADHAIHTDFFDVPIGLTCGLHQHAIGRSRGEIKIELDLKMYLDAPDPHDMVRIIGEPPVEAVINGGIAGDSATVAALVNAIPRLLTAQPGLLLMTDLGAPIWGAG